MVQLVYKVHNELVYSYFALNVPCLPTLLRARLTNRSRLHCSEGGVLVLQHVKYFLYIVCFFPLVHNHAPRRFLTLEAANRDRVSF